MNVEIGTEAAQFQEKEYINEIFIAVQGTGQKFQGNPIFFRTSVVLACCMIQSHLEPVLDPI
jgi:hypothetical protein